MAYIFHPTKTGSVSHGADTTCWLCDDVDTCAECGHPVTEHAEHYGCWACPCSLNPGPFDPSDG